MDNKEKIIYFAAAMRGDRAMETTFHELIAFLKESGLVVLTEHMLDKNHDTKNSPEHIEKRDIAWLDEAAYVIAEISGASTGTGREIEYARTKKHFGKTPANILCLYHIDREFSASPMIRGMTPDRYPNVSVKSYRDIEQAKEIIKRFLDDSDF